MEEPPSFPTDGEIVDLGVQATAAADAMWAAWCDVYGSGLLFDPDFYDARARLVTLHEQTVPDLAALVSPALAWEELDRVTGLFSSTYDAKYGVYLDRARTGLASWAGSAAETFTDQLSRFDTYRDAHGIEVAKFAQCLAAAFSLGRQVRKDCVTLTEKFVSVAETASGRFAAERDAHRRQRLIATLKIVPGLVAGVLGAAATAIVSPWLGAAELVDTVIDTIDKANEQTELGGARPSEIVNSYIKAVGTLSEVYSDQLDTLAGRAIAADDLVNLPAPPLATTHNAAATIHSPAFRYEEFQHRIVPPGDFGPTVDQLRADAAAHDTTTGPGPISEIAQRLAAESDADRAWGGDGPAKQDPTPPPPPPAN